LENSLRSVNSRINTGVDMLGKNKHRQFLIKDEHFLFVKLVRTYQLTILTLKVLDFECVLIFSLKLSHYVWHSYWVLFLEIFLSD